MFAAVLAADDCRCTASRGGTGEYYWSSYLLVTKCASSPAQACLTRRWRGTWTCGRLWHWVQHDPGCTRGSAFSRILLFTMCERGLIADGFTNEESILRDAFCRRALQVVAR